MTHTMSGLHVESLILYVLWITVFPVDKQLEPVSQSKTGLFSPESTGILGAGEFTKYFNQKLENNDIIFSGFIAC